MKYKISKCILYKGKGCFLIDKLGFTLIEMIVTVAIVSLLLGAAYTVVDPVERIGQAKDAKRSADLIAVAKAIELYTADYGALPADFNVNNISDIKKVVLCSQAGTLSCDGQNRPCLVVDDSDFLGTYLFELPVDPNKSNASDTGYYISRGDGDAIVLGSCNPHQGTELKIGASINMPTLVTVCGDGDVEGNEFCDDGATLNEGCGNSIREDAGTYCNSSCSANIIIGTNELCDFYAWSHDCWNGSEWFAETSPGSEAYCNSSCNQRIFFCLPPP